MKKVFGSVLRLGLGEAVSRLSSFALFAYVSRKFGVELLGAIALSQTVAAYVTLGTDQGLRMIGARMVAREPGLAARLIPYVITKRATCCVVCVAAGSVYALWGPVPAIARLYVLGFVLAVVPYALSLDWLAWGLDHFAWLGAWRAGVGLVFAFGAIGWIALSGRTLLPITVANATGAVFGAGLLWALWRFRWRKHCSPANASQCALRAELRWAVVLPLGISTVLNLMFNNFDTIMLGAMTSAREVGRYNAAYKILFVVFGGYYLLTQSLYPRLSRVAGDARIRGLIWRALLGLFALGSVLAVGVSVAAHPILRLIYGSDLNAARLLQLLAWAIPMDFCTALLGTVLVSRGFDKPVLWGAVVATISDIGLNLWLIPRMGATGAAWATLISYVVLLATLAGSYYSRPVFAEAGAGLAACELASSL